MKTSSAIFLTNVAPISSSPVWERTFNLTINRPPKEDYQIDLMESLPVLSLKVWDDSHFPKAFLGQVLLSLHQIFEVLQCFSHYLILYEFFSSLMVVLASGNLCNLVNIKSKVISRLFLVNYISVSTLLIHRYPCSLVCDSCVFCVFSIGVSLVIEKIANIRSEIDQTEKAISNLETLSLFNDISDAKLIGK